MYLEREIERFILILFYEPARRRIYIEPLDNKSSESTSIAL